MSHGRVFFSPKMRASSDTFLKMQRKFNFGIHGGLTPPPIHELPIDGKRQGRTYTGAGKGMIQRNDPLFTKIQKLTLFVRLPSTDVAAPISAYTAKVHNVLNTLPVFASERVVPYALTQNTRARHPIYSWRCAPNTRWLMYTAQFRVAASSDGAVAELNELLSNQMSSNADEFPVQKPKFLLTWANTRWGHKKQTLLNRPSKKTANLKTF